MNQIRRFKSLFRLLLAAFTLTMIVWLITLDNKLLKAPETKVIKETDLVEAKLSELGPDLKIDWVNYTFLELEKHRTGPGEKGKEVHVAKEEKPAAEAFIQEYSYNALVSDKISLDRSIPDTRPSGCQRIHYYANLPAVSVIIIFRDEHLSALLRTVHSIFNRTPPKLLREVILVDDFSTKEFLKADLDRHLEEHYGERAKVIRLPERSGLMKARMAGIRAAQEEIVVVMDAHMEVNTNWLPPLIEPICENYRTITEPCVDYIDWNTFAHSSFLSSGARGGFTWGLTYITFARKLKPNELETSPYENPVLLGAIMGMSKRWFWELGGYDEQLEIWGGEQYEISFKSWMCGGRVLGVPCSHVGHNYKGGGHHPYMNFKTNYIWHNLNRIADVWFDEYKEQYYRKTSTQNVEAGNETRQIQWRTEHGCKSFQWYLDNVLPEMLEHHPVKPPSSYAHGVVRNVENPHYCVDGYKEQDGAGVYSCASDPEKPHDKQYFIYTFTNQIRKFDDYDCWDVWKSIGDDKFEVSISSCHDMGGNQYFTYDQVKQTIKSNGGYCLDSDFKDFHLYFVKCEDNKASQRWTWGYLNSTAFISIKN